MKSRSNAARRGVDGSCRRHAGRLLAVFVAAMLGFLGCPAGMAFAEEAGRPIEIRDGHLDIGPALDNGHWNIRIKDDSSGTATWRDPGDVVLRVSDAAKSAVPAGAGYDFLGAAGSTVYLVPQTQTPGVVWVGWNTRHPGLLAQPPASISLSLKEIEGPGALHVFLDYGGFRPPEAVWDSTGPPAELPVAPNVHTHANWAFSAPGEYRTSFTAKITPKGAAPITVSSEVRFLVGDATPAANSADGGRPAMTWWLVGVGIAAVAGAGAAMACMRTCRSGKVTGS
ncbi:hypothetical protein GCM10022222_85090 [Amycolatopsis ultiminotia]|uniref:Surface-anchored protein n=1 Tax=Amycolatopsis ultiminotia TaxID=543629 RepID=A0ABP6YNM7_9PSEU